jgi:hypothetical protein
MKVVLETERLLLREYVEDNAQAFAADARSLLPFAILS